VAAYDIARLRGLLAPGPAWRLSILDITGSTNDDALRLAEEGAPEGTVVLADRQTLGRGRWARVWHSPPALGLYASVVLRPSRPIQELPRFGLAAAAAARDACAAAVEAPVALKWPNDVVAGGRKLAGVLVETRTTGQTAAWVVVGVGVNVNHGEGDFPPALRGVATSLRMLAGGRTVDREAIAAAFLCGMAAWNADLGAGRWAGLAAVWAQRAPGLAGMRVRVLPAGWVGTTRGLTDNGAIAVERPDGSIVSVHQGDSLIPEEA
jgi:BirA family biotin operon repressor/biotin-[acetyl-CoA-carboxylase] ligase